MDVLSASDPRVVISRSLQPLTPSCTLAPTCLTPLRWNLPLPTAPPTIPSSLHHSRATLHARTQQAGGFHVVPSLPDLLQGTHKSYLKRTMRSDEESVPLASGGPSGPEISCWICLDLPPHDICFPSGSGIEGLPEVCGSGSRSFKWKLGLRHILTSSWSSGDQG